MATRNDTTNARPGASPTTYNDWLAFPRWLGFPKDNQRIRWGWENRGGWTDYARAKKARPYGRAGYIHGYMITALSPRMAKMMIRRRALPCCSWTSTIKPDRTQKRCG